MPEEECENETNAEAHEPREEQKGGVLIFGKKLEYDQDLLFLTALRGNRILGRH